MKLRNKKTGKIGELSGVNRIVVYEPNMPLCGNSILGEYDTLAKLNEEWEDYKPKEPLIKDEKIRKSIRVWAEAEPAIKEVAVMCHLVWGENMTEIAKSDNASLRIVFPGDLGIKMGKYTIAELCGEEEE